MKEMRFYIDTPSIEIGQLSENNDFQMDFDIKNDDFIAKLNIRLDPESIKWDSHDGEDYPRNFERLIVSFSSESEVQQAKFLECAYFKVIEYLNIFFRYLQIELGQYWVDIGTIQDWDLLTFLYKTSAKGIVEGREVELGIPIGGYSNKITFTPRQRQYPDWSDGLDGKQTSEMKAWIEEHKPIALEKQLLAQAKRLFLHGEYKSSSVLAITVLERPLEKFIKERCKSRGVSKKTLDTYDKNHYVSDYLKLLLPLVLEQDELTNWADNWLKSTKHWFLGELSGNQIIDWAIELNQARNKAVHEGKEPEFETIDKGIFAIEAIYEFVKEGH